ncbi:MAG: zinc-dependent peptidase [Candidatus Krumholzibacteriia bacterium]
MFFLRGRRRKKLLQTPLDPAAREVMQRAASLCAALPGNLRARHEGVVQVLLAEKHFEGAGGLALTEPMRLAIAGQAALLQLRDTAEYYPGLDTILVYPEAFVAPVQETDDDGFLVHDAADERAGESWQRGVVVISWQDAARESRRRDGYNVVLHEFAHQLDELTGEADGSPPLPRALLGRWADAFQAAFEQHQRNLRRRRPVLYDEDAAESPCEFFATTIELFFELPRDLAQVFPDVYALVAEYLELDPAHWSA